MRLRRKTATELGANFSDGQVVVTEGDPGSCMYVIQEGRVEVSVRRDGHETVLCQLGEGDFFGEMSLFQKQARSATVRALGAARLLTIDRKTLLRRFHENPALAYRIVEALAGRVRALTDELATVRRPSS